MFAGRDADSLSSFGGRARERRPLRSTFQRDGLEADPTGRAISNLQRLSADWLQRYGHPILLVETYVDPQRFEGTCYRAAKWIEIGLTKGFGRSRLDFYQLHQQPKAFFLYPLVPNAAQILSAPLMPPAWAPYGRIIL